MGRWHIYRNHTSWSSGATFEDLRVALALIFTNINCNNVSKIHNKSSFRICTLSLINFIQSTCIRISKNQINTFKVLFLNILYRFWFYFLKLTFISDSGVSAVYLFSLGFLTDFFTAANKFVILATTVGAEDFLSSFLASSSEGLASSLAAVVSSALSVSLLA